MPGVVLNVVQNETYYVLVHNNSWIDELPFIWNSKSYNEGDSIKIIGFVYQKTDSLENSFFELEISNYNVRQNLDSCLRCKKSIKFTPLKQLSHEKKDFCRN